LRNTTKDYFKSKKDLAFSEIYTNTEESTAFEDSLEDETNILEELEKGYQAENIKQALAQLKADEKELIFLRFSEWKPWRRPARNFV